MIEKLRTPDERFTDLPGYDFAPHYVNLDGLRMHHVDEGKRDRPVFLCLHGQPTWSYLYRKMIPVFADAGRVIAPDLFGFGRSDKPVADETYTFDFHRVSLLALIDALDLSDITLVCQDWGGILGLTLPMDRPDRFSRLVVMNTTLGTGDRPLGQGFDQWRAFNRTQPDLDVAALMQRATPGLSSLEAAAYAAPFPDVRYKAGVRRFPDLMPSSSEAGGAELSRCAARWWAQDWRGLSFMAIGAQDPVLTPAMMETLCETIRGCPPAMVIPDAGHFVQEWGEPVAHSALAEFAKHVSVPRTPQI